MLETVQIEENVSLAAYTTLKIGGPARYFAKATSEAELLEAIAFARHGALPIFVLGGGSNLVVADTGFAGLVVQLALNPSIVRSDSDGYVVLEVSAGNDWNDLVLYTCERGISGIECLAGIPGLVGGTPIQNIGAYGQEVAQTIDSVTALDLTTPGFVTLSHEDCGFGYRRSIFNSTQRGRYIITSVRFRMLREAAPNISYADLKKHFANELDPSPIEVYFAVREIRERKGMLIDPAQLTPDTRSAGSFFKNPVISQRTLKDMLETLADDEKDFPRWPAATGEVKLPAAWLIEKAGFAKGFTLGRAGISSKHTLALVNRSGDASCSDLLQLRDLIILTVEQRFGITLEQEPVMLSRA